jgi:glucose-1-phosphate thymidylyltransferase
MMHQNKKLPRGIILAGGNGTRLHPLTLAVSKQLLPVYKYPMICYPINTLMQMNIKDIMIITMPDQQHLFEKALRKIIDENDLNITFAVQHEPKGLPEAFIIAEQWLDGCDAVLILGDNIIINHDAIEMDCNSIYTFPVQHPERYGVVTCKPDGCIDELIEKPQQFISKDAVIGMYALSNAACQRANLLKPSKRNELEIVDLIRDMDTFDSQVKVKKLNGFWFDAGNHDDLLDCANLVRTIEQRSSKPVIQLKYEKMHNNI